MLGYNPIVPLVAFDPINLVNTLVVNSIILYYLSALNNISPMILGADTFMIL
jgi:hypothetical protein